MSRVLVAIQAAASAAIDAATRLYALDNGTIGYGYLGGTPQGHHFFPQYMCGASAQKKVKLSVPDHTLLHVELDLLAKLLELIGNRTSKIIKSRSQGKASIKDIGKRKLGRIAIAGGLYGFYEWFNWLNKGAPTRGFYDTIEDGFLKEIMAYINGPSSCK